MFNTNIRNVTTPLFHFDKLLASFFALLLVARKMKKKEKQKKRRAYEPKLTPEGNLQIYILQFLFPALYIKYLFMYLFLTRNDGFFNLQKIYCFNREHFGKSGRHGFYNLG